MQTPESIRAALITGEWVSSTDLADTGSQVPLPPF